eukprot:scaffold73837_cov69-Phaeocystis_antarctica.AAC.2
MSTQQRPWSNKHVHRAALSSAGRRGRGPQRAGAHTAQYPQYRTRVERSRGARATARDAQEPRPSSFIKYFAISEHRGERSDLE